MNRILRQITLLRDQVPDFKSYPYSIPAIKNLDVLEFDSAVTFFIGENGSGKSTLIEAIAIKAGFNAEGGSKNFNFSTRPSESNLHEHLRLARGIRKEKWGFFLRAESMFNVSTEAEEFRDYGWDDLHEKSHGEAFLWVVMNRFRRNGLYLLDEPESALSPQRLLSLLVRIHDLVNEGSQFIISTHSPILMAYPGATIYELSAEGISKIKYEHTEHYCVTKNFLADHNRVLKELFRPSEDGED